MLVCIVLFTAFLCLLDILSFLLWFPYFNLLLLSPYLYFFAFFNPVSLQSSDLHSPSGSLLCFRCTFSQSSCKSHLLKILLYLNLYALITGMFVFVWFSQICLWCTKQIGWMLFPSLHLFLLLSIGSNPGHQWIQKLWCYWECSWTLGVWSMCWDRDEFD